MNETGRRSASRSTGSAKDDAFGRTAFSAPRPSLAALVFTGLVLATVGAFFLTTRLKRSAPVIEQLRFNRFFSPNGDGRLDYALFGFRLRRTDQATVSIVTRDGDRVTTLASNLELHRGRRYRFRWNGRTDTGRPAPDGEYRVRVSLRRQGRVATSPRKLILDTTPPRPFVRIVSPPVITPGAHGRRGRVAARFAGPRRSPTLLVYRTDLARPRLVARRPGGSRSRFLRWDGRVGLGATQKPAPAGSYLLAVRALDAAGNAGPVRLPPTRRAVRGRPGVTVRYLAALAPHGPTQAGHVASFAVFAAGKRYQWHLRRLGSPSPGRHGRSRSGTLRLHAPSGGSGLSLLELRAGHHVYETPFTVQARRHRRVLVVVPAISWQAVNPVEQNGDGYPDVLPVDRAVAIARPFEGRGLPATFSATALLLAFLDAQHLRYDITTDLALSSNGAGALGRYDGVLIAGSERFAPVSLTAALGAYVRGGGRLAWVGTGSFSRSVTLAGREIVRGGPASPFGERVRRERKPRTLAVLGDRIDFFSGVNGAFGPFPVIEPSLRLPPAARPLASAGAEAGRPDIVVYRLGRGIVSRVGVDGFARGLRGPSAGPIMRRLWTLLSR